MKGTNSYNLDSQGPDQATLLAYLDGQLDADQEQAVRSWLDAHPTEAEALEGLAMLPAEQRSQMLAELNEQVEQMSSAQRAQPMLGMPVPRWVAVAAILVVMIGGVYLLQMTSPQSSSPVVEEKMDTTGKDRVQEETSEDPWAEEEEGFLPIGEHREEVERNELPVETDTDIVLDQREDLLPVEEDEELEIEVIEVPLAEVPSEEDDLIDQDLLPAEGQVLSTQDVAAEELPMFDEITAEGFGNNAGSIGNVYYDYAEPEPLFEPELSGVAGVITGYVFDAESGEPLIGAAVKIKNSQTGTYTDIDGSYSLKLAPGFYEIDISYLGFELYEDRVMLSEGDERRLNATLEQPLIALNEAEISSNDDGVEDVLDQSPSRSRAPAATADAVQKEKDEKSTYSADSILTYGSQNRGFLDRSRVAIEQKRYADGLGEIQHLLLEDEIDAELSLLAGRAELGLGDASLAAIHLDHARNLSMPFRSETYLNSIFDEASYYLAESFIALGRQDESVQILEELIEEAGPWSESARIRLDQIR